MKHVLIFSALLLVSGHVISQDMNPTSDPGKLSARIYSNFHYGLNKENSATAFEIARAYFGYKRSFSQHYFAEVKLDIGSIDDQSQISLIRRYTYFKNAYVGYNKNKFTAWVGLFDMLQFKTQEKFWGYRYLYKSYMDEYRFGPSADIGAGVKYEFSRFLSADIIISNGEGYKTPQYDQSYKTGLGISLFPLKGLTFRTYYTIFTAHIPQMSFVSFLGYQRENIRIGAEYIHQWNFKFNEGHNRYGYSLYSTYMFNDKWEIFARYDHLFSNIIEESNIPWNLANDGSAIITGVQYAPIKHINVSLNYQDWVEYASNGSSEPSLYLNFEINF